MSEQSPRKQRVEYGVKYGDGEVDLWGKGKRGKRMAIKHLKNIRRCIAEGSVKKKHYEPMAIVARTVTIIKTPWEVVPAKTEEPK